MDHVITSGDVLLTVGFLVLGAVAVGVLIWMLSVYASGFKD